MAWTLFLRLVPVFLKKNPNTYRHLMSKESFDWARGLLFGCWAILEVTSSEKSHFLCRVVESNDFFHELFFWSYGTVKSSCLLRADDVQWPFCASVEGKREREAISDKHGVLESKGANRFCSIVIQGPVISWHWAESKKCSHQLTCRKFGDFSFPSQKLRRSMGVSVSNLIPYFDTSLHLTALGEEMMKTATRKWAKESKKVLYVIQYNNKIQEIAAYMWRMQGTTRTRKC